MTTGELVFFSGVGLLLFTLVLTVIFAIKRPRYMPEELSHEQNPPGNTQKLRSGFPTEAVTRERAGKTDKIVEQGTVPLQQGTIPLQQDTVPLEQGTIPLQQDTVPLEQGTVPLEQGTVPLEQGTVPLEQGTVPLEQGTVPLKKG